MTPEFRSPIPSSPRRRLTAVPAAVAALAAVLATVTASKAADAAPATSSPTSTGTTTPAAGDTVAVTVQPDPAAELADTQERLATALRSYSLLMDENAQLKAAADKSAADQADLNRQLADARATIASLQAAAAASAEIAPLRVQVRDAQAESSRLASDNAALRTRLALQGPAPASDHPAPTRPAPAPAVLPGAAPAPDATPAPDAAAAAPAPARTYTVAEGDTLGKIALKFYGSASQWPKILEANKATVPNETSLAVGTVLTIP